MVSVVYDSNLLNLADTSFHFHRKRISSNNTEKVLLQSFLLLIWHSLLMITVRFFLPGQMFAASCCKWVCAWELWALLLRGWRDKAFCGCTRLTSGFLGGRAEGRTREGQLDSAHRLEGCMWCQWLEWLRLCNECAMASKAWSGEQVMLASRF